MVSLTQDKNFLTWPIAIRTHTSYLPKGAFHAVTISISAARVTGS